MAAPPVAALHRDVLHCIFAFLGQRVHVPARGKKKKTSSQHERLIHGALEYVSVAGVCRSWRDAAYSAPAGFAEVQWRDSLLQSIVSSPLRHCIGMVDVVSTSSLELSASFRREFAAGLPHLRRLRCNVDLQMAEVDPSSSSSTSFPLHLPPRLESLHLNLSGGMQSLSSRLPSRVFKSERCKRVASIVSCLAGLSHTLVTLHIMLLFPESNQSTPSDLVERFAWVHHLRGLTRLRELEFDSLGFEEVDWPSDAINVLRDLPHLTVTPQTTRGCSPCGPT